MRGFCPESDASAYDKILYIGLGVAGAYCTPLRFSCSEKMHRGDPGKQDQLNGIEFQMNLLFSSFLKIMCTCKETVDGC